MALTSVRRHHTRNSDPALILKVVEDVQLLHRLGSKAIERRRGLLSLRCQSRLRMDSMPR